GRGFVRPMVPRDAYGSAETVLVPAVLQGQDAQAQHDVGDVRPASSEGARKSWVTLRARSPASMGVVLSNEPGTRKIGVDVMTRLQMESSAIAQAKRDGCDCTPVAQAIQIAPHSYETLVTHDGDCALLQRRLAMAK